MALPLQIRSPERLDILVVDGPVDAFQIVDIQVELHRDYVEKSKQSSVPLIEFDVRVPTTNVIFTDERACILLRRI